MKGRELIRCHKKVNSGLITTTSDEGIVLKTFYNLLEVFNKQKNYEPLRLEKIKLWELCGFQGEFKTDKFYKLIEVLTEAKTYHLKNKNILSGSMFVTEIQENGMIDIHVPKPFRKYLFYKRDIDLMHKAKQKEKMSIEDLDYYDREVKPKSKELVLLNKAHILGIKGKYNLRLYTLLKQWDSVGKYQENWKQFKEILEVPQSYTSSHIDLKILNKARLELLKANIKITKIDKIKKGRSIDKIKILFKTVEPSKTYNVKPNEKELKILDKDKEEIPKLNREESIKKMIIEDTHIEDINRILKIFKYEETTLDELISISNK